MRERHRGRPAWATRLIAGAAGALLAVTASPALAQEDDADEASGPAMACELHDPRTANATGIVAVDDGWWLLPDKNGPHNGGMTILRVGADCNVRDQVFIDWPSVAPEDLAIDSSGRLWAADIGTDSDPARPTVSVTVVEPDNPVPAEPDYRFIYPEGHQEAKAFILTPGGEVYFIPAIPGQARLYGATGEYMQDGTDLEQMASFAVPDGEAVIGAAMTTAGDKLVLRTASNAYEWDVEGGDVVAALAGETEPRVTPLDEEPEPQGIAYDADGAFLTVAKTGDAATTAQIRRYTPTQPEPEAPVEDTEEAAAGGGGGSDKGFLDRILDTLGVGGIINVLAFLALIGLGVMIGGIVVIRRARKLAAEDGGDDDDDDEDELLAAEESPFGDLSGDDEDDPVNLGLDNGHPDPEVGQLAQGVYGSAAAKPEPTGNVYGAAKPEAAGSVYGGAAKPEPAGGVYGAPREEASGGVYGGAREEPRYEAFESKGHGSIYSDDAPAAPTGGYGGATPSPAHRPESTGGVYGAAAKPEPGPVYGGAAAPPSPAHRPEPTGGVYGAAAKPEPGPVYGGAAKPEPAGPVYGGAAAPAAPPSPAHRPESTGGVYGAAAKPEPGPVYGGAAKPEPAGGVYGGTAPRQDPPGGGYGGAAPRQEPPGAVYGAAAGSGSTGSVYGAGNAERTPEPEDYWGPSDGGYDRRR